MSLPMSAAICSIAMLMNFLTRYGHGTVSKYVFSKNVEIYVNIWVALGGSLGCSEFYNRKSHQQFQTIQNLMKINP